MATAQSVGKGPVEAWTATSSDQNPAPAQQSMDGQDGVTIVSLRREDLQTNRLREITHLQATEFSGTKPCCCCIYESESETHHQVLRNLSVASDRKFDSVGVAINAEGNVLGFTILGYNDTEGDVLMPPWMSSALRCPRGKCHLEEIIVSPEARGKGVSTKLLLWADAKARERGIKVIYLEVLSWNTHAMEVYEKAGYVKKRRCLQKCCLCPCFCILMRVPYIEEMEKGL